MVISRSSLGISECIVGSSALILMSGGGVIMEADLNFLTGVSL